MDTKLAYIAGMIDADGHMTARTDKNKAVDVGVTNTDKRLMDWLVETVGGNYAVQRATCEFNCQIPVSSSHYHKRNDVYKWHVTGYTAIILLQNILPHLIIKADRARDAISFWEEQTAAMQRPARRQFHIRKESARMAALGWAV